MQSPSKRVFNTLEIGLKIVSRLFWEDLLAFRIVDHGTLALTTCEIEERLKQELTRYLPNASYDSFLTIVKECQAGIVAGALSRVVERGMPKSLRAAQILRRIAPVDDEDSPQPLDLNLLVPVKNFFNLMRWFKDHGFGQELNLDIAPAFREDVVRFVSVVHPEKVERQANHYSVCTHCPCAH